MLSGKITTGLPVMLPDVRALPPGIAQVAMNYSHTSATRRGVFVLGKHTQGVLS